MKAELNHHIFNVIQGGDFTGPERKPMGRVTVDHLWNVTTAFGDIGAYPSNRTPIRWWVSATNPAWKNETEIPTVKSIHCEWNIEQDAGQATIVLYNTDMTGFTTDGMVGDPGHLTPDRGESGNRWGHAPNEWEDAIVPSALIRTYQGYGGYNADGTMKSIQDCLDQGYIVQTGTWVIDDIRITTDGTMTLSCRDMMFLLIDQYCFPPLIPTGDYPFERARYRARTLDTPRIDYGPSVGNAKLIVGGVDCWPHTDAQGVVTSGYNLVGDDGGVFSYGAAEFFGSNISVASHSVIGIAGNSFGLGQSAVPVYYVAQSNGVIDSFSRSMARTGENAPVAAAPYVDITSPYDVNGLYLCTTIGEVAHINTTFYGGTPATPWPMVSIASRPLADGYWMCNSHGQVYAYGSAPYWGNTPDDTGYNAVAIKSTLTGNGYWITNSDGKVYAFGDATHHGDTSAITLNAPIASMIVARDGSGYWLVADDGGVFAFGPQFYGSLVGTSHFEEAIEGDYNDWTQIVRDLLLYSGFWLHDETTNLSMDDFDEMPAVYGALESTGSWSIDTITPTIFDKLTILDCITKIKEIVGYIFLVRGDGSVQFSSPNWWGPGNFLSDGTHTASIPTIDERYDMLGYGVQKSQRSDRSLIIISTDDPLRNDPIDNDNVMSSTSTITTKYIVPSNGIDRGVIRPTLLFNLINTTSLDQQIMAELISLHIMFQRRLGSATCVANPLIEIDDQVQLYEQQTEEMWTHYVRGISTDMDLDEGSYEMNITTHQLGDRNNWAITIPDGFDEVP